MKYKPYKILNIVKCSRNFVFEKRTDQKTLTHKISVMERTVVFSKKKGTVKNNVKRMLYMDIFWLLLSGGPFLG